MKYTETRRAIFLAIAKNGGAKMSDMAKDNNISETRVRFHIAQIRDDFDTVYTIQVTPICAETYGKSDAIFNAIHNT
jgi:predicted ArsR family transcriptional regulator